jgi:hypothetical protein
MLSARERVFVEPHVVEASTASTYALEWTR